MVRQNFQQLMLAAGREFESADCHLIRLAGINDRIQSRNVGNNSCETNSSVRLDLSSGNELSDVASIFSRISDSLERCSQRDNRKSQRDAFCSAESATSRDVSH